MDNSDTSVATTESLMQKFDALREVCTAVQNWRLPDERLDKLIFNNLIESLEENTGDEI